MSGAEQVDRAFRALSDPTRRRAFERLCRGPASMTELCAPFDITLPTLTKHLRVLERAGLVTSTKSGRVRTYRATPAPLRTVEQWLSRQRDLWERRLDQLDEYLETLKDPS